MRLFAYGAAGALLGLLATILLCAIAAVALGGPSADPAAAGEATSADMVVAYAPLLALIGLAAGTALGILRATRRRRPSRFVN